MTAVKKLTWHRWPAQSPADDWETVRQEFGEKKNLLVLTPAGLVNMTSPPEPSYNFWEAHTNFPLSVAQRERLARIPGVETLDVPTSYRFRVGVARLFSERAVKRHVEGLLLGAGPECRLKAELSRWPFWAICQDDAGKRFVYTGGGKEAVLARAGKYRVVESSWGPA